MNDEGVPRSRDKLAEYLEGLGVPPDTYHLYGCHGHETLVLDRRPQGWVIFYSERGAEDIRWVYEDEADACARMVRELHSRG